MRVLGAGPFSCLLVQYKPFNTNSADQHRLQGCAAEKSVRMDTVSFLHRPLKFANGGGITSPYVPLQQVPLVSLQNDHILWLIQAFKGHPGDPVGLKNIPKSNFSGIKNVLNSPFEQGTWSKLSALKPQNFAKATDHRKEAFTISSGGSLVPKALSKRAFSIAMPWDKPYESWRENVTLFTALPPYKLAKLLKGIPNLKGMPPEITPPQLPSHQKKFGNDATHQYQKARHNELQSVYDFFMAQEPLVQQNILRHLPWFTNPHSAWHQLAFAKDQTWENGELVETGPSQERIFPGHFWLGVNRIPLFAISVPRRTLENLIQNKQIGFRPSRPAIDSFDYLGVPDAVGLTNGLSKDDRYISRTLFEGSILAKPNLPRASIEGFLRYVKVSPYWQSALVSPNHKKLLNALLNTVNSEQSAKPLLSRGQLKRSVMGHELLFNKVLGVSMDSSGSDSDVNVLGEAFQNWQHMTMRDYWHVAYHLDFNNALKPTPPVSNWYFASERNCNGNYDPCANARKADIPIGLPSPRAEQNTLLDLNQYIVPSQYPNPSMWDVINQHGFNGLDLFHNNPHYMYSDKLKNVSNEELPEIKQKIAYLLMVNLAKWRGETISKEVEQSVQGILNDPKIQGLFIVNPTQNQSQPGFFKAVHSPKQNISPSSPNNPFIIGKDGFTIPVPSFLQYVPHGSENNSPFHHGLPQY